MLSGPHRKFCEGIVSGLNQTEAYRAAYPKSSADAARSSAPVLLANPSVKVEIERLRAKADEKAGSAVLTLVEKRNVIAGIVRAKTGEHDGCRVSVADKIAAMKLDADLAGHGSEAGANDALAGLLGMIRK